MPVDILSDDSDVEDIDKLNINEHYAKAFEYRKEREELEKLKEKYGSDGEEDEEEDSEDLESEDEDGEELTPAVDAAILLTLARIKRKDPAIYEQGKDVFEEEVGKIEDVKTTSRRTKDKSKPVTMKQQVLASALNADSRSPSPEPVTHVAEQEALRKETIAAFHTGAQDEDEDDDLLVPREKTKDELEREEEEYKEFLERQVGQDLKGLITLDEPIQGAVADEAEGSESRGAGKRSSTKKEKTSKKSGKNKKEEDQEFLMNYILNRGWIDRSARHMPTYKEITSDKKGKGKARAQSESDDEAEEEDGEASGGEILDEDEFEDIADRFETSYNFRFEEPGADKIPRYPRNIGSAVRREDSTRKEARERRKARKEEELLKKKEEVKRLKSLKMKELRSKLARIGKEGGKKLEETEALAKLDLDGDWDPDAYDKQMADIYGVDDDAVIDEEKPQWDDDIDIGDIVPEEEEESEKKKKKKKKKKAKEEKDEGGVDVDEMDADVERDADSEQWDGTEEMRKKKLDEYMDEIYGLEFNDMVAGMPTRFKYTKAPPQSFGLSPVEILMATDAELNQYMGIKKYAPYRRNTQNWDKDRGARLKELRAKIASRRSAMNGGDADTGALSEKPAKKRKGKKERMKAKAATVEGDGEGQQEAEEASSTEPPKKRRKTGAVDEEERDEATGDRVDGDHSGKKKRRRHKKSGHADVAPA